MNIPTYKFATVDSVMNKAVNLQVNNIDPPFAVVSKEMTAASGRFNKKWHASCKDNLHLCMALPLVDVKEMKNASIWFGLKVCKELQKIFPKLFFEVKWPNDIYCNGKKISGMVSRMWHSPITHYIVGIGLNVNTSIDTFPLNYRSLATSLKIEMNEEINIEEIEEKVKNALYKGFIRGSRLDNFYEEFNKVDYIKQKKVIHPFKGIGYGIEELTGYYLIKRDNDIIDIVAGDIILENEKGLKDILEETGCHFFCTNA